MIAALLANLGASADLNTILIAVAIGVLGWIAFTAHQSAVAIAAIQQSLDSGEKKFDRHELELAALRTRLSEIELQLVQLRR